jgi:dephospho-CoA kinase
MSLPYTVSYESAYLIGLTGGIGSGKTTVARLFEQYGARIVDADQISRELTISQGAAIPAIIQAFGARYIDETGSLDRSSMRQLFFTEPDARIKLQTILHPMIFERVQEQASLATSTPYTLIVAPLLFEVKGYRKWVQRTLVIDCPEELQIERTMRRSGLSEQEVKQIMAQQLSRSKRLSMADDRLENQTDRATLVSKVAALHTRYLKLSAVR